MFSFKNKSIVTRNKEVQRIIIDAYLSEKAEQNISKYIKFLTVIG